MKGKKLGLIAIIVIFIIGGIIYSQDKNKEIEGLPSVDKSLLSYFEKNAKFEEIISYGEEDINEDKRKDLVVVYKKDNKSNEMVVIINEKDNIYMTAPTPAPKEDVVIEFRNIDDKNPMEIVISGSKNGNVGYGIYRLENKKLLNLFGEKMEACC
ncbi:MAG: Cys-Cys-COOH (seleno)protein SaoC [Terrisporobacter sp.]|uniref:Cys-Cys-COOH (seleno)protein SaoC n=1 Tax=Terrisporobacter sp. TaxID=1965305 RepID=UPI002FCA7033